MFKVFRIRALPTCVLPWDAPAVVIAARRPTRRAGHGGDRDDELGT
jgi:hypothetical protein